MTDWTDAACRPIVRAGSDLWHKPSGSGESAPRAEAARIRDAKAVCATCPVKDACLAAATDDDHGIWGGLTRDERRAKPKPAPKPKPTPRTPQPCGTKAAYQRHRYKGEPACDACRKAIRAASKAQREKAA